MSAEVVTMEQLVREVGKRVGCTTDEVERSVRLLDDHWVTTLADWLRLPPSLRNELGLPVDLASSLPQHDPSTSTSTSSSPVGVLTSTNNYKPKDYHASTFGTP